ALKLPRLDPVEGMRRTLSRETAAHALRGALAFAAASAAMLPPIAAALSQALRAQTPAAVAAAVWTSCQRVAFAACAVGTLFALAEYLAARGAWLRKLRMSFDERKREAKEHDGDPFARSRRRALHRSLVRGPIAKVKDAAFVVVNPAHIAIAMEYRPPHVGVPRVLVRAAGDVALRVRALARLHAVPVIENAPLARSLFCALRVGQSIAREHYVAVAEIVVAVARDGTRHP
ncbi:MAG: EscU/YscU/HrcU family type III secretion system export apparatus switch protein, partial [Candidatus Eremiobacteraeota bacterium]|nr:EscU/YscU/HrcU family type III secretion system export apparatus switch protein [Candidatus Eremiobacteraeota bacterium]